MLGGLILNITIIIIVCISVYLLTSYFQNALKTIADSGKEDEEDRRKGG